MPRPPCLCLRPSCPECRPRDYAMDIARDWEHNRADYEALARADGWDAGALTAEQVERAVSSALAARRAEVNRVAQSN